MKKIIVFVVVVLLLGVTACNKTVESDGKSVSTGLTEVAKALKYTNIKAEEAKKRLESEKGIIILDVRTQEEYLEKHIPNSLLIPVEVIEKEAPSKLTDKNAVLFVYCRSGRRSVTAADALVKMGYTKVFNLGGINDWPYETKSGK